MLISEKIAYLNGLFDGLDIDATKKEGKILKGILDVMADIATSIEDLEADIVELNEGLEDTFDDIDEIYGELDGTADLEFDDFEDEDCDDESCGCGHHHGEFRDEFGGGFEQMFEDRDVDARGKFENELGVDCDLTEDMHSLDEDLYQVVCPTCGEEIFFDEATLDKGAMICHACGEDLEFDLSGLDEENDEDTE